MSTLINWDTCQIEGRIYEISPYHEGCIVRGEHGNFSLKLRISQWFSLHSEKRRGWNNILYYLIRDKSKFNFSHPSEEEYQEKFERYKKFLELKQWEPDKPTAINKVISDLSRRIQVCWDMAEVFLKNKDAHGIHDMGVEIQALQRALDEVSKL